MEKRDWLILHELLEDAITDTDDQLSHPDFWFQDDGEGESVESQISTAKFKLESYKNILKWVKTVMPNEPSQVKNPFNATFGMK